MNEKPTEFHTLTIEDVLRWQGRLQLDTLRAVLGDRLVVSPWVEPGQAIAVAPLDWQKGPFDHLAPGTLRDATGWERAAQLLQAGGTLVVSKAWVDGLEGAER